MASIPKAFKLERYFAKYEFNTKYLLCCSDPESLSMKEVIDMADPECKKMWDELMLSYTDSQGHFLLRQESAKLHNVNPEEVLIITPQEGIYIAMHCLVNSFSESNPHVIATFPAYQSLYENLKTLKCDVDYWTAKESETGWQFDIEDLKSLIRTDTKLLVVNFPHNPTGFVPNADDWKTLVNLCRDKNIFLFSDEMYRLSNNDGQEALESACSMYTKAVSLSGMSKTFALPGLRIGWLCTQHKDIMESMKSFKDYITICSPAPSEILSIIALRNYKIIIERTVSIVQRNLDLLDSFFAEYPDIFRWYRPNACTTGLLKLTGWSLQLGTGGASGFCEVMLKEAGVLLLPSSMYDFPDQYMRIGFGRKNLPEALSVLRAILNKYHNCYKK